MTTPSVRTPVAGADPAVVGPYLAGVLGPEWADCSVVLISGGKSNLTYRVDSAAGSLVLRRPPLGHVLPTAHDMKREFTVMAALAGTAVPVPKMRHLCADPDVLGEPFYVMERIEGHICRDTLPPGYADEPAQRRLIGEALVGVLADLHAVDPDEVGLSSFGRPDGYLERQVRRWGKQWEATRIAGHDTLDTLAAELAASLPTSQRTGIVHGDYRLDHTMLHPTEVGRIAAVLDWEMSTLGDPLADLGVLLVYWSQSDDSETRNLSAVIPSAVSLPGFPSRTQVAELYAARTGADLTALPWCMAFGFFKLAVVCAGIVKRVEGGAMVGDGFAGVEGRIRPLVELGRSTLADHTVH